LRGPFDFILEFLAKLSWEVRLPKKVSVIFDIMNEAHPNLHHLHYFAHFLLVHISYRTVDWRGHLLEKHFAPITQPVLLWVVEADVVTVEKMKFFDVKFGAGLGYFVYAELQDHVFYAHYFMFLKVALSFVNWGRRVPTQKRNSIQQSLREESLLLIRLNRNISKPLRQLLSLTIEQQGQMSKFRRLKPQHFIQN